jgi:uncharacterized membrane protein YhaH (DUF805 family)
MGEVMEFVPAVRKALQNYALFEGRAIRSEYWWFALFNVLCLVAATLLDTLFDSNAVEILVMLALALPGLGVGARRLHDLDRSGWWLLAGLVPVFGTILLIVWFATRGTPGPNRFGPDPLSGQGLQAPA